MLTSALSWHWVFLVNLPIGALVCALCFTLLSPDTAPAQKRRLDVAGAITVTLSSMLAVYAIVDGNYALLAVAAVLLGVFLVIESRVRDPLMPLRLFRIRSVAVSNVIGVLWAAAMFAWFFISALYMQLVLGYTPMQIGLAFLPANLIMAVFSIGLSAKLVMRFGLKLPIAGGMLLTAAGLGLLALAPSGGGFVLHVLPGMLLLGVGCGMALNPVMLAAMSDVDPSESGLASGVVNTSFMMGGALGLAALASLSEAKGYHAAFAAGALFAALAAVLSVFLSSSTSDNSQPSPKGHSHAIHDHRESDQGQRSRRHAAGVAAGRDGQVPRGAAEGRRAARRQRAAAELEGLQGQDTPASKRTIVDGPFTSKDLIAGYTMIQTKTREEAKDWARRYPNPTIDGSDTEIEVRQVFELEDFEQEKGK